MKIGEHSLPKSCLSSLEKILKLAMMWLGVSKAEGGCNRHLLFGRLLFQVPQKYSFPGSGFAREKNILVGILQEIKRKLELWIGMAWRKLYLLEWFFAVNKCTEFSSKRRLFFSTTDFMIRMFLYLSKI